MGEDGSADKVQQWDGEKWLNFKYILKMEPTGFFFWINVVPERRGVKNNTKLFSLSTWKQGCCSLRRLWIEQIWENSPELSKACVKVAVPTRYPSEDVE